MKVILTGTTGFVGAEVLRQCLLYPSITSLVVLSRRPLSNAPTDPKLKVVILEDFTSYPPQVVDELKDADACIWALGIKDSDVAAQRKVTIDYTLTAARAFTESRSSTPQKPFRFVFTSGILAIRDPEATALYMGPARKVKGEAETQLLAFAAEAENNGKIEVFITRPGLVHRAGTSKIRTLMQVLPASLAGVKVDELAAVSVNLAVNGRGEGGNILENAELVVKGKELLKTERENV